MSSEGKNYQCASIGALQDVQRETLHDALGLTGAEVSVNRMAAGGSVPFLHSHKVNEEIYVFLKGRGVFQVDGEQFEVQEGSVVRVDAAGKRCIKAADDEDLSYLCIQAAAGSLTQFTMTDGVVHEGAPVWR
jgi:mannose-6-phosphate isomerase-like protein (cupin superfamily)